MGQIVLAALGLIAVALMGLWVFGPREPAVTDVRFDSAKLSGGVDAYLAQAEARFADITPGAEKSVIWAGDAETKTAIALVYIHGFSATSEEVRPLPDLVAGDLGANLVYTRLAGHGRGSAAMSEPRLEDWMTDVAEAIAIGHAVGDKVILLSTSTGGTVTTLALTEEMGKDVAGTVMISPNFRVNSAFSAMLTWPAVRWWLPYVLGAERSSEPRNDLHATYATTRYASDAVLPMATSVATVRKRNPGDIATPALFIFDPADRVVDAKITREIAAGWGGPAQVHLVDTPEGDDPYRHVIAGEMMSPSLTAPLAKVVLDWVQGL